MRTDSKPGNDNFIFGLRAVIEAIEAGKEIEKILIQRGIAGELFNQLRKALRGSEIPFQIVPPEKIKRLTNKNHQGVIAFVAEVTYYRSEDLLPNVFEEGKTPLLLILDRVTDVRNFGAIARSAECAGVDFIIIPSRGSAQINADAIKTSAGALHRIPVCRENNVKETIAYLKEYGLQVIACHEKTDKLIYASDFSKPTAILMGSEDTGISSEYLKLCDYAVKIPMPGKTASLNVSVATGIVLFEAIRQKSV
ncbi:MAG TPA: 23S rRNA (guanosine(2251)-2'-O)-methyltransferase RlmB [Bacteroidia bacterium]|jgi:23S rRNA (guanosine2251-2'-O)-methyltransferase|nr:23S rRNA (guanosine(2251)-2'-O)-methyltransferase RlmB [Bacteroidia bacterium]